MFQIEVNKTYGISAWRSDLKRVLKMAGADGKQVQYLKVDFKNKLEIYNIYIYKYFF